MQCGMFAMLVLDTILIVDMLHGLRGKFMMGMSKLCFPWLWSPIWGRLVVYFQVAAIRIFLKNQPFALKNLEKVYALVSTNNPFGRKHLPSLMLRKWLPTRLPSVIHLIFARCLQTSKTCFSKSNIYLGLAFVWDGSSRHATTSA